jgi:hypothetical protein
MLVHILFYFTATTEEEITESDPDMASRSLERRCRDLVRIGASFTSESRQVWSKSGVAVRAEG